MLQVSTDELASALTTDIQYFKGKSAFTFVKFLGFFQVGKFKKKKKTHISTRETVCMVRVPTERVLQACLVPFYCMGTQLSSWEAILIN